MRHRRSIGVDIELILFRGQNGQICPPTMIGCFGGDVDEVGMIVGSVEKVVPNGTLPILLETRLLVWGINMVRSFLPLQNLPKFWRG